MSGEGAEEERLVSFLDPPLLADLAMCNIEVVPGAPPPVNNLQLLVMVYRVEWNTDKKHMNQHFSALFQSLMRSITFKVLGYLLTHVLIDSFRYRFICTRADAPMLSRTRRCLDASRCLDCCRAPSTAWTLMCSCRRQTRSKS